MDSNGLVRLRGLSSRLRTSLWFLPTLAVAAATVLAALTARVTISDESPLAGILFGGGATGARGMLQAVAGSVITVTSLVFSLTVVTLQLASSQFSPRLLRTFLRDRGNQVVLSVFLATFAYSLTVLRTIRAAEEDAAGFVPQLAVSGAFLLAMASVAALVYFINHIAQEIRVDTMMEGVERDTRSTIEHAYPDAVSAEQQEESAPQPPAGAASLPALRSGYVQDVAVDSLANRARELGVVLRLHSAVGGTVTEHAPLLWAWTDDGRSPSDDALGSLRDIVHRAVQVGHERTEQRDVAFGLRQLVDIAAKALSPGVNDPTTAVHAISHLSSLLCLLAGRRLGDLVRRDDRGVVRVGVPRPGFEEYLDLACGQIRRYGGGEPAVVTALLFMLRDVAACLATDPARKALGEQEAMTVAAAERAMDEPRDLEQVRLAAAAVQRAIGGDLRP